MKKAGYKGAMLKEKLTDLSSYEKLFSIYSFMCTKYIFIQFPYVFLYVGSASINHLEPTIKKRRWDRRFFLAEVNNHYMQPLTYEVKGIILYQVVSGKVKEYNFQIVLIKR